MSNIPTIEKQKIKTKRINRIINYFMEDQERNKYVNTIDVLLKAYVTVYEYYEKKRNELHGLIKKKGNNKNRINQLNYIIEKLEYQLKELNILINENIKNIATIIKSKNH